MKSIGLIMNGELIETFYQQPGARVSAEEYQAKGYLTRVGRWKGEWALWVEKHDQAINAESKHADIEVNGG